MLTEIIKIIILACQINATGARYDDIKAIMKQQKSCQKSLIKCVSPKKTYDRSLEDRLVKCLEEV